MFCLFVSGLEDSSAFYIFFFIFFNLLSDYSLALLADYSWTGHGQGKHCIGSVCDLCRHFPNSGRINCYLIVRRHITTTSMRPSSIIMNAQPIRSTATTLPVISLVKKKGPAAHSWTLLLSSSVCPQRSVMIFPGQSDCLFKRLKLQENFPFFFVPDFVNKTLFFDYRSLTCSIDINPNCVRVRFFYHVRINRSMYSFT